MVKNLKTSKTMKKLYSENKFIGTKGYKWTDKQKENLSEIRKRDYKTGRIKSWNKGKVGVKTSFKGQIPWNKNIKGNDYKQHYPNGIKNIYEKGNKPWMTGKHLKLSSNHKTKLRLKALNYIEQSGNVIPFMGKHEKYILDQLEEIYKLKIIRQYKIESLGFFIDGYIRELNLAIEVDEKYHNKKTKSDRERQKLIEEALNCKFLRIEDRYD
jgi:hypothetical protein